MSETLFALVTAYGPVVIFASAFLSCLALPIPTSLMMLAGGAFIATGDLAPANVIMAAWVGAVLGDQTGYVIGRRGGAPLADRLARRPSRRVVLERARTLVRTRGPMGVFLSTWLFAPLGPWVNVIAGTAGLSWRRFTVADVAGETIWVTLYVGLGYLFADRISTVAEVMSDIVGLIAALGLAGLAALWIRGALRQKGRPAAAKAKADP